MNRDELLSRISVDPNVCGGAPCIRGTRIPVAVILDSMAEGMDAGQVLDHFPSLKPEDIRAAHAYAGELARENVWKFTA